MALPLTFAVSVKTVSTIPFFKGIAIKQFGNNGPKLVKWKAAFLASLQVALKLTSDA